MTHNEAHPGSAPPPDPRVGSPVPVPEDGDGAKPTPPADPLAEARAALSSLLSLAKVEQIICIDDDFAVDHEDNAPTELLDGVEDDRLAVLGSVWEGLQGLPPDVRSEKFKVLWRSAKLADRKDLHGKLEGWAAELRPIDLGARKLAKVLGETGVCPVHCFTFRDWQSRQAQLLGSKFDGKFTLLLIDQDFGKEGGDPRGGIEILRTLQASVSDQDAVSVRCALLTNTKAPGEEHSSWDQFATDENLTRSRFMLISKARLSDDQFGGFVLMTRLTVLNPLCEKLRGHAARVYEDALVEAVKQLGGVTIYDVERIVFASSRKEGVWEPDTLFRILGLFLRREARRRAAGDTPLRDLADEVRGLAGPTSLDPKAEDTKAKEIRRLELYEDGDYLNKHHTPIDLGDVFEVVKNPGKKDESRKRYLLVAQPCEMMVRVQPTPGGRRRPTAVEAVLIEVVKEKPKGAHYQLDYFEPNSEHAYAVFGRARVANLNILDLCVFRQDGQAEIASTDQAAAGLIPSWRARHAVVLRHLASCLKEFGRLQSALAPVDSKEKDKEKKAAAAAALSALMRCCVDREFGPNPLFSLILAPEEGGGRLKFSCQRIRRLSQPWAGALLTEYAHNLSRAAFEHDFGQEDAETVPRALA
jgi:hypothetical protein